MNRTNGTSLQEIQKSTKVLSKFNDTPSTSKSSILKHLNFSFSLNIRRTLEATRYLTMHHPL